MKKLFVVIAAIILVLSACGREPEIQEPIEENQEKNLNAVTDSIYLAENGKYGFHIEGRAVTEGIYDEYKNLGRIGGTTLYALGRISGTKPVILYNEDAKPYGIGETEKILYDIYNESGELVISYPFDDAERYDKETLFASLDGSFYSYTFSDEGAIIEEETTQAGKTGTKPNGLDEVVYYYNSSPLSVGRGIVDEEDNVIIPAIYNDFCAYFDGRITADARNGFGMMNSANIYDEDGNLLCSKYHAVIYKHMDKENNQWLGIGYVASSESQIESICRDENGELMKSGYRFIDKDGNELSTVFTDDIKDEISSEKTVLTLTDENGETFEVNLKDYYFIP